MPTTFILAGPLKGKTITLGHLGRFQFTDGCMVYDGQPGIATFLAKNWQAYPEGDTRLKLNGGKNGKRSDKENENRDKSEVLPEGEGDDAGTNPDKSDGLINPDKNNEALPPGGNGHPQSIALRDAIATLSKDNPEHWTRDGKPHTKAVSAVFGKIVTRYQIEQAIPGYIRENAV